MTSCILEDLIAKLDRLHFSALLMILASTATATEQDGLLLTLVSTLPDKSSITECY